MVISQSNYKIDFLYALALEEGEGFGTAYEYFVKIKLLFELLDPSSVRSILMAGLPEKYGFSLDIFLFANLCGSKILVVDTDTEKLGRAEKLIKTLAFKKMLSDSNGEFKKVNSLCDLKHLGDFDLSVSPLMVQQLSAEERLDHIRSLLNISRSAIITAPNRGNDAHGNITGLNSISISEVKEWKTFSPAVMPLIKCGFLDMPPFPPGVKIKKTSADRRNSWTAIGLKFLECWAAMEGLFPEGIKSRMAHIVYLFASRSMKR